MARRAYFAFHYQNDISRVNVIRNSWVIRGVQDHGFYDASLWEECKRKNEEAIKSMIRNGLENTSVTVFLLGAETAGRKYVRYELEESYKRGNGLVAVFIHKIKNLNQETSLQGKNIFDSYTFPSGHSKQGQPLSSFYKSYNWVNDDGYNHIGDWIEFAARQMNK